MKNKKFIAIIFVVLFILSVVFIALARNSQKSPGKSTEPSTNTDKTNIEKVLEESVYYPAITSDSNILFFAGKEQAIKKFSLKDSQISKTYKLETPYITNAFWSNDSNLALIKTQNQNSGEERYYTYNLDQEKLALLDQYIINPYWKDDKLVYQYVKDNTNALYQSDWDGKNYQKIIDLSNCDDFRYYNSEKKEAYCELSTDDMLADLVKNNSLGKSVPIYKGLFMSEAIYPEYQEILVQYQKDNQNYFDLIDTSTNETIKLNNPNNINDLAKFNFTNNKLAYSLNSQSILKDYIYFYDVQKKTTNKYQFISGTALNPKNIMVDKNSSKIYFISDQTLYYLNNNISEKE